MTRKIISSYTLGDMQLMYQTGTARRGYECVGMLMIPSAYENKIRKEKEAEIEPLIQVKIIGDAYPFNYSQGRTMRNSETVMHMKFTGQHEIKEAKKQTIVTEFQDERGLKYEHYVVFCKGWKAVRVFCKVLNHTGYSVSLEMLSSFTLGGITPFENGIAKEQLVLHQIRSTWANEGRLVSIPIEELQLEPSWKPSGANGIRYGQVGSMPNREYFPFIGIEDKKHKVCWGAQIAADSSWQIEAYRRDDGLSISGGLADREKGHWIKKLDAGESFTTPEAIVSVAAETIDSLCQRITSTMQETLAIHPEEKKMPVIFNEFCTTWGNPDEEKIKKMAKAAAEKGIQYFVIDAGWYKKRVQGEDFWSIEHGDWEYNRELFPSGMKALTAYIHQLGMKAGIWFEFETCGRKADMFENTDLLQYRDGYPITAGNRRFFNMTEKAVWKYLDERVLKFLKENEFNYIKIDYNDNLGIGADGRESQGEMLRESVQRTREYFKHLKREIPGLLIENCSAGGHRLTEPFLAVSDMSSYSDAHESLNIPIVAANMHRMIPVRQSQIWAVLQPEFSEAMLYYKLSSAFLGRMCISGNILEMTDAQQNILEHAISFYAEVSEIIEKGQSIIESETGLSYKEPDGYQIVKRMYQDQMLVTVHTFAQSPKSCTIESGDYRVKKAWMRTGIHLTEDKGKLKAERLEEFDGMVILLKKERKPMSHDRVIVS